MPVLLYCPVDESINDTRQSCVRGMPASTLSSEYCTVQVLVAFGSIIVLIVLQSRLHQVPAKKGDCYWEVSVKGGSTVYLQWVYDRTKHVLLSLYTKTVNLQRNNSSRVGLISRPHPGGRAWGQGYRVIHCS